MTMVFHSLCEVIEKVFNRNWKNLEKALDDNHGCLDSVIEDNLQAKFKAAHAVENFRDYYTHIGEDCPDAAALGKRLRAAITNSKAKRYHGCSEHMNVLPGIADQTEEFLWKEPSPFSKYDNKTKKFTAAGGDPCWRKACIERFDWINRLLNNGPKALTASELALKTDKRATEPHRRADVLSDELMELQQPGNVISEIQETTVYEDYPDSFDFK